MATLKFCSQNLKDGLKKQEVAELVKRRVFIFSLDSPAIREPKSNSTF